MWTTRAPIVGLMLALIAPACAERPSPDAANAAAARTGKAAVAGALRFIEDDAPTALAEAKRRGVPIFVEAWAPW
ncbi:MAG TPA: hypothetical protein VFD06_04325 [Candidatus Polarisedimenticolia bacterium]|nr:hypothetical protein [Candidatus Polarisedimenticolia bacterium]